MEKKLKQEKAEEVDWELVNDFKQGLKDLKKGKWTKC